MSAFWFGTSWSFLCCGVWFAAFVDDVWMWIGLVLRLDLVLSGFLFVGCIIRILLFLICVFGWIYCCEPFFALLGIVTLVGWLMGAFLGFAVVGFCALVWWLLTFSVWLVVGFLV